MEEIPLDQQLSSKIDLHCSLPSNALIGEREDSAYIIFLTKYEENKYEINIQ